MVEITRLGGDGTPIKNREPFLSAFLPALWEGFGCNGLFGGPPHFDSLMIYVTSEEDPDDIWAISFNSLIDDAISGYFEEGDNEDQRGRDAPSVDRLIRALDRAANRVRNARDKAEKRDG